MPYTRRTFLETAGALAAAGSRPLCRSSRAVAGRNPSLGCAGCGTHRRRRRPARLFPRSRAIPRPSRERGARTPQANRQRDLDPPAGPRPAALDRRGALEDAGRPARADSSERARDGHPRAARLSNREVDVREPAASLRDGESLRARANGTPPRDSGAAGAFGERQSVAQLPEALHESGAQGLRRPRVRPVRAG